MYATLVVAKDRVKLEKPCIVVLCRNRGSIADPVHRSSDLTARLSSLATEASFVYCRHWSRPCQLHSVTTIWERLGCKLVCRVVNGSAQAPNLTPMPRFDIELRWVAITGYHISQEWEDLTGTLGAGSLQ